MMLTHKIFFATFIAISFFQFTSSINSAGPPWYIFDRQDITGVAPQPLPPPHSISKNLDKTASLPVLPLVAALNSEEEKTFKEEMKKEVVKKVHT